MKIPFIVALSFTLLSITSIAAVPVDANQLERNKAKIVSRLYQASYGPEERCKKSVPAAAAEFSNELQRFSKNNANLISLLTKSPYYDLAKKDYSSDSADDTPQTLAEECEFYVVLLRSMNETPEGKAAVKEFEEILSK
ncbi:MAG: hypothetical protein V4724_27070 [Pseudomonadota bacterium]